MNKMVVFYTQNQKDQVNKWKQYFNKYKLGQFDVVPFV